MNLAETIREMVVRGLTTEQALIAIEVFEVQEKEKLEARLAHKREVGRERQRRHRSRVSRVTDVTVSRLSRVVTPVTRDKQNQAVSSAMGTPLARVDTKPTNLEHTGKKNKPSARDTRDILLRCLKPETADAVLAHRKALRCPLTFRGAELLVKGFNSTADPDGAANEMILRGWRGFKAGWEKDKPNGPGKRSISDVAPGFIRRLDEQFAFLDEVRPKDSGADGGPTVRVLPGLGGKRS